MGKSSNFATVPARLIVDGKDHGIQMFIVQLRDMQTHQPLPGKLVANLCQLHVPQTLYTPSFFDIIKQA